MGLSAQSKFCCFLLASIAILSSTQKVEASAQDLFGFGARGPALSGAFVALAHGFESVYYNPAGLANGTGKTFSFAYQAAIFDLSIQRPNNTSGNDRSDIEPTGGIAFGFDVKLPLKAPLSDRIALGVGMYVPTKELLSAKLPQPGTPQFWMTGANARSVAIHAGLGVKLTEWLQIGGGIRALAALNGFIDVKPGETGNLASEVEDELVVVYSSVIGAVIKPHQNWFVGLVWRDSIGAHFELPINADLGDLPLTVPEITIAGTANYDPMQAALHLGWKPSDNLALEVGVLWKNWSDFPLSVQNATSALPTQSEMSFSDTVIPRFGIEYRIPFQSETAVSLRSGYAFEPTPAPEQTTDHNILDGDRHIVSSGVGIQYKGEAVRIDFDLYGQAHLMAPTEHIKSNPPDDIAFATSNAGYPWISGSGQFYSLGASLEIQF